MRTQFKKELIFIEKGSMVCNLNEKAPICRRGLFETTTSSDDKDLVVLIIIYEKKYFSILFLIILFIFFGGGLYKFFIKAHNV